MQLKCATALLLAFLAGQVNAAILLDQSFDATGEGVAKARMLNFSGQHFVDDATFVDPVEITGISTFSSTQQSIGVKVHLKIFANSELDTPGILVHEVIESIDAIDQEFALSQPAMFRTHATLSIPIRLAPGTYWFGMASADAFDIGQAAITGVVNDSNAHVMRLNSDQGILSVSGTNSAIAIQIEGRPSPVPLPAAAWYLGMSMASLIVARRSRGDKRANRGSGAADTRSEPPFSGRLGAAHSIGTYRRIRTRDLIS